MDVQVAAHVLREGVERVHVLLHAPVYLRACMRACRHVIQAEPKLARPPLLSSIQVGA